MSRFLILILISCSYWGYSQNVVEYDSIKIVGIEYSQKGISKAQMILSTEKQTYSYDSLCIACMLDDFDPKRSKAFDPNNSKFYESSKLERVKLEMISDFINKLDSTEITPAQYLWSYGMDTMFFGTEESSKLLKDNGCDGKENDKLNELNSFYTVFNNFFEKDKMATERHKYIISLVVFPTDSDEFHRDLILLEGIGIYDISTGKFLSRHSAKSLKSLCGYFDVFLTENELTLEERRNNITKLTVQHYQNLANE